MLSSTPYPIGLYFDASFLDAALANSFSRVTCLATDGGQDGVDWSHMPALVGHDWPWEDQEKTGGAHKVFWWASAKLFCANLTDERQTPRTKTLGA